MADSPHKFTFEFAATTGNTKTGGAQVGWSESWYRSVIESNDKAEKVAEAFQAARRKVLTLGWSILACRVSQLDNGLKLIRRGLQINFAPDDQPGTYISASGDQDEQPYDALLVNVACDEGTRRPFLMRGIPNGVITAGTRYAAVPQYAGQLETFEKVITGQVASNRVFCGMDLRFRFEPFTYDIVGVLAPDTPTPLASRESPRVIVVLPQLTDPVPQRGDFLSISGVLGMDKINATWQIGGPVTEETPLTYSFRLTTKRRTRVLGLYQSGGRARVFGYRLSLVTGFSPVSGASKRTGRPTQALRGRRSNRAL